MVVVVVVVTFLWARRAKYRALEQMSGRDAECCGTGRLSEGPE